MKQTVSDDDHSFCCHICTSTVNSSCTGMPNYAVCWKFLSTSPNFSFFCDSCLTDCAVQSLPLPAQLQSVKKAVDCIASALCPVPKVGSACTGNKADKAVIALNVPQDRKMDEMAC